MQAVQLEQLTTTEAEAILAQLPDRIKAAYVERATRMNYPMTSGRSQTIEAVLEMALAGYLDAESMTEGRS